MMILLSISTYIVFFLFCLNYLPLYGSNRWLAKDSLITLFFGLFLIVASVFSPIGSDKATYIEFFHIVDEVDWGKDIGWTILTRILHGICLGNHIIYLFVLAFIYVFAYYAIGKCKLGEKYVLYFLLLSAGCLGFWSGATNILRAGIATSFFFFSLCMEEEKKKMYILFSICACMIHNSVIILVVSFFLTKYVQNFKYYIWLWLLFLLLSSANALTPLVSFLSSSMGDIGDRLAEYAFNEDSSTAELYVKAGFRIDFILYSALPIVYSRWIVLKQGYNDLFYKRLSCTYILVNCFFLTMIRVPYADRFALLSWSLISLIILYPYMNPKHRLKFNPMVVTVAFLPVLLQLVLILR